MNARIIELIKNKELLQPEDLNLLKEEIKSKPYIQSFRALYLLGTSKFDAENYQQRLSETAAYTTDKKILYHLINGEPVAKPQEAEIKNETSEEISKTEIPVAAVKKIETEIPSENIEIIPQETAEKIPSPLPSVAPKPEPVYVKGELNRILFEGEEDFMGKEAPKIDLEASQESGQIVVADPEIKAPPIFTEETAPTKEITKQLEAEENKTIHTKSSADPVAGSPEAKVEENNTHQDKTTVQDPSVLSFHRTAEFLPDIKMNPGKEREAVSELPKPKLSKHEEEMRKLVEEVERKIKEKKARENLQTKELPKPEIEEDNTENTEVSFGETQPFAVSQKEQDIPAEKTDEAEIKEENKTESEPEKNHLESSWKPMEVSTAKPDALIEASKQQDEEPKIHQEKTEKSDEKIGNDLKESTEEIELPVMNVSFFAPTISTMDKPEGKTQEKPEEQDKSNVPHFLNTWQSWLKIDRSSSKPEETVQKVKAKAIEKFIESEPKISQLRDEGSYIIKEKKDDISHLMTETLAKIYTEQKLYTKAIQAYEILSKKHPEKEQYFMEKVQKVKALRNPQ